MFQDNLTKKFNNISLIFLFVLPIGYIFSTPIINLSILIIVVNFIYTLIVHKNKSLLSDKLFIILLIFWIYISVQSLFLENANFFKSFSFVRFILLPFAIYNLLRINHEKISILSFFYLFIILLVIIDLLFQYVTGVDFLGYRVELINGFESPVENWRDFQIQRFSGPFGEEIRAGTFLLVFGIISIFFIRNLNQKNEILIQNLSLFILLVSIIITGDRSPLITFFITFLMIVIFSFNNRKYHLYILSACLLIFLSFLSFSKSSNFRYIENTKMLMTATNEKNLKSKFLTTLKDNPWSAHYLTAYEIFKSSILFGKGVKSFKIECKKFPDIDSSFAKSRCSTHPHNIFMELISETGLIGLILFLSALVVFIKRNYYDAISSNNLIFFLLIAILVPIKPTGALFSTWFGSLIWIIMGFSMLKKNRK